MASRAGAAGEPAAAPPSGVGFLAGDGHGLDHGDDRAVAVLVGMVVVVVVMPVAVVMIVVVMVMIVVVTMVMMVMLTLLAAAIAHGGSSSRLSQAARRQ
jgi:F0F1-type ATP synthase membrane subunit c/vacuolar-type H+-ATPase subunit K